MSIVQYNVQFEQTEKKILRNLLTEEFHMQGEDEKKFSTTSTRVKKDICLVLFGIVSFISISLYFFNYSLKFCLVFEIIASFIYYLITRRFNVIHILAKHSMKNPDEDFATMIRLIKEKKHNSSISDELKHGIVLLLVIFLAVISFMHPRVLYVRYDAGYSVFRYTRGIIDDDDVVNIPATYKGKKVLAVSNCAFKNSDVKEVYLPDTIEYLGGGAFSHCSWITEITIPKSVTEINGQTFEHCVSLRTVNLHDDIVLIHGEVFVGATRLTNIVLPPKITEVRGNTFEGCSSLTSIVIPEGVTRIGGHAFRGCSSLSYVSIPSTVTEIGSSAFRKCSSLYSVEIPYTTYINERAFKESPTIIKRY